MKNDFIVLLVGASGSGKTTLAEKMEQLYGWESVVSYTTRPKRSPSETGHIFVSDDEFDRLIADNAIIAYTEYSGYRYCATAAQADECQIYVIDIPGVLYFRKNYTGNKKVLTALIDLPEGLRRSRMQQRGDTSTINFRLETDRVKFSEEQIRLLNPDFVIDQEYTLSKEADMLRQFAEKATGILE